jgi:hypothetical protein
MFRRFRRRSSGGESADVLIIAAHMSLASGNTAIARRALAEAVPKADPDELFFIARIYLDLGEPDEAEACLRRAADGGSLAAIKSLAELQADRASSPGPSPAAGGDLGGTAAISAAEQMIHTYEANGQLSLLTSAIDTLRSLLDDNGLLDPFSRHHARHALGTALWSLFERTGDLAALDESAALLKSAAEAAGVPDELRLKSRSNLAGVLNLRARHADPDTPAIWAAHIHVGP